MKGNKIKLAFEVCRCVLGECRQLSVGWVLNRAVSRSGLWFFFNASFLRRMNRIDQFFLNLLYYCTVVFLFTTVLYRIDHVFSLFCFILKKGQKWKQIACQFVPFLRITTAYCDSTVARLRDFFLFLRTFYRMYDKYL